MFPPEPISAFTLPRRGLDGDVSGFRTFARRETLGEEMSWREPCRSGQDSGGRDETPAGKEIRIVSKRLFCCDTCFSFS